MIGGICGEEGEVAGMYEERYACSGTTGDSWAAGGKNICRDWRKVNTAPNTATMMDEMAAQEAGTILRLLSIQMMATARAMRITVIMTSVL